MTFLEETLLIPAQLRENIIHCSCGLANIDAKASSHIHQEDFFSNVAELHVVVKTHKCDDILAYIDVLLQQICNVLKVPAAMC